MGTPLPPASQGLEETALATAEPARRACMICGGSELVAGLDLGHQPVGDLILGEAQLNEPETYYPMQLFLCETCGLCQLGYTVDPSTVYQDFPFVSGTTRTATRHLQDLAQNLAERLDLGPDGFAVDVGSNDGTLLKGYADAGVKVLGIDPAALPVRAALEAGVPTWHAFFDADTAQRVVSEHGQAEAISAAGCFGHIANLDGVMRGVRTLLKPGGIFCSDNQYWLDIVEREHYDNVFHQHLRNYSMRPLVRLHADYDLDVFDVERSDVYGGSIRVFTCHAGDREISPRVGELLELEDRVGLYDPAVFTRYADTIAAKKRRVFDTVHGHVRAGRKVIGIGAPAKASTVCNYCGLGADLVDYITEVNPLRYGKYLPGVHIPIVDEELMFSDPEPADAGILFAWNYHDEIVPKLRERGWHGELIEP
jgi:SAM-dependent methyltransferase